MFEKDVITYYLPIANISRSTLGVTAQTLIPAFTAKSTILLQSKKFDFLSSPLFIN